MEPSEMRNLPKPRYLRMQNSVVGIPRLSELNINPWTVVPRESYKIVLGRPSAAELNCPQSLLNASKDGYLSVKPSQGSVLAMVSSYEDEVLYPDLYNSHQDNTGRNDVWVNARIQKLLAAEEIGKSVIVGDGASQNSELLESNPFQKATTSSICESNNKNNVDISRRPQSELHKENEPVGELARIIRKRSSKQS